MKQHSKARVVFVDDDRFYCLPWVAELEEEFAVDYYQSAGAALKRLMGEVERVVLVLDLMMPPPTKGLEVETDNGQLTGIWVLRQCREPLRRTGSQVILLTNVDVRAVHMHLGRYGLDDVDVRVMSKKSATPGSLLREVRIRAAELDHTGTENSEEQ